MTALIAAVGMLPLYPQITKSADLVGIWEGLSLCADKKEFPTVKDEQVVCHVSAKDAKIVLVEMNKIVYGKEESMADEPFAMTFDAKTSTLTGRTGGRKPSVWTFHLNYSTWSGEARDANGKLFRNILVKRRG